MNRWTQSIFAPLTLALAGLCAAASAQTLVREAPRDVQPGWLAVATPPAVTLDGQADRLSPGARIRDTRNMLVLPAYLSGQQVPVLYRRDGAGLLHELWLLTASEYAQLEGKGVAATSAGTAANAEVVRQFQESLARVFKQRQ